MLKLRAHALERMNLNNIPNGMPVSELEKVFVPVYLMHRYQVEAVSKQIGGYEYTYAVRGKTTPEVAPVDLETQMEAIASLVETLQPSVLAVPDQLKRLIPPPAMGYSRDRESFKTQNGGGFDPMAMALAAADNSLTFLLHPHRAARIVEQHAIFPKEKLPNLENYLTYLSDELYGNLSATDRYERTLAEVVHKRSVAHLVRLAVNKSASEQVRAEALAELVRIMKNAKEKDDAHHRYLYQQIDYFLDEPGSVEIPAAPSLPDGSPIGCGHLH
ncbi:MAG: zinc-dependent metalloprotease [Bacteroidota bacterium]